MEQFRCPEVRLPSANQNKMLEYLFEFLLFDPKDIWILFDLNDILLLFCHFYFHDLK